MEFKLGTDGKFTRCELKDSTEFRIVTKDGNVKTIPNFNETTNQLVTPLMSMYPLATFTNIVYQNDIFPTICWTPMPFDNRDWRLVCHLPSGKWTSMGPFIERPPPWLKSLRQRLNRFDTKMKILRKQTQMVLPDQIPNVLRVIVCAYL